MTDAAPRPRGYTRLLVAILISALVVSTAVLFTFQRSESTITFSKETMSESISC